MTQFLESKTGIDGSVTVIHGYTVQTDETHCFTEVYQENARIASAQTASAVPACTVLSPTGPETRKSAREG